MNLLLWITISFILIGFSVLISMKKGMENKLAFLTENVEHGESASKSKSIIWWIVGATVWGIVSIILIVLTFHHYFS